MDFSVGSVGAEVDAVLPLLVDWSDSGGFCEGFVTSRGVPTFTSTCSWTEEPLLASFVVGVATDVAESAEVNFFALVLLRTFLICLTNSSSCWPAR